MTAKKKQTDDSELFEDVIEDVNDEVQLSDVEDIAKDFVTIIWTKNVRHEGSRCKVGERANVSVKESESLLALKVARLPEV